MNQCFSDNCKIGSGVPDLDEISDLLGIDKVSSSCLPDLMVQNYFEYESNSSEPILKGRLQGRSQGGADGAAAPPWHVTAPPWGGRGGSCPTLAWL